MATLINNGNVPEHKQVVRKPAVARLTNLLMFVILAATLGCPEPPPKPNPNPNPPASDTASKTKDGIEKVPAVDSSDQANRTAPPIETVPEKHDPADPIDLSASVEETREIFVKHGLPKDWYKSLKDSVLVSAIWTSVGPDVASAFQQRFKTARKPMSRVSAVEVYSSNKVFDEMLHRALQGDEHRDFHVHTAKRSRMARKMIPNVNPLYVKKDGSVAFRKLHEAFVTELQTEPNAVVIDNEKSSASDDDELSLLVTDWMSPPGVEGWAAKQLVWRPVIRVEFVEGERKQDNVVNKGERRMVLSCYAQVGFRKNENAVPKLVYLAGPFVESYYQPVGTAFSSSEFSTRSSVKTQCPKNSLVYRDLDSLNAKLEDWEQEQADAAAADTRPASEVANPNWTSESEFDKPLQEAHKKLDALLRKPIQD